MKKFSVLNEYKRVVKSFYGCHIDVSDTGMVKIFDKDAEFPAFPYLKALHNLLPGHTICHMEEVKWVN